MRATAARVAGVWLVGGAGVLACVVLALMFGEQPLDWSLEAGSASARILTEVRLPRVALAVLVGASLSAAGSVLQSLLRNPLADPFVLGVSGGAALGATAALALGLTVTGVLGFSGVSACALAGAVGATALVLVIGRRIDEATSGTLLAGVIFNAFALAAILFIKLLAAPDKLGSVLYWLAGSLGHESWSALGVTAVLVAGCGAGLMGLSPRLNLLALGDDDARSLGVEVGRTRLLLLLLTSAMVASAVSLSGLVGFVGLLVPHLARLLVGADQRLALPASTLLGACFLVLADLLTRLLFRAFSAEPPVGVLTALLGGPAFLLLAARRR